MNHRLLFIATLTITAIHIRQHRAANPNASSGPTPSKVEAQGMDLPEHNPYPQTTGVPYQQQPTVYQVPVQQQQQPVVYQQSPYQQVPVQPQPGVHY